MNSESHVQHAIRELQSKKMTVVAGTTSNTDITVTGISVGDTIGSAIQFTAGVPSDITANASVTAANTIQFSSSTAGDTVIVEWYAK